MAFIKMGFLLVVCCAAFRRKRNSGGLQDKDMQVAGIWPTFHCNVLGAEGSNLCWEGPATEGRLSSICGGSEVKGKCKQDGYSCDVSGLSFERFTVFLGLTVYSEPSEEGDCVLENVDLREAALRGTFLSNDLCPNFVNAVRKWHEDAHEQLSNMTTLLVGCSKRVRDEHCTQTFTGHAIQLISQYLFKNIESRFGIVWAKRIVFIHDAVPAIEQGASLADKVVDVPEGVKGFASRFRLSLAQPVDIAKKLLHHWNAVTQFLSQALKVFLKPLVDPIVDIVLNKFRDASEEHVQGAFFNTTKLQALQESVKSQLDGVINKIELLCSR